MKDYTQMDNGVNRRKAEDDNRWKQMLAMLSFAQNGDPQTMLGFGIGRALKNLYQNWEKGRADDATRKALEEANGGTAATVMGSGTPSGGLLGTLGSGSSVKENYGQRDRVTPTEPTRTGEKGQGMAYVAETDTPSGKAVEAFVPIMDNPDYLNSKFSEAVNADDWRKFLDMAAPIPFNPTYRRSRPKFDTFFPY